MFRIRYGTKDDCIAIEGMINELAIFEMMETPKIDHKVLERDGFGDQRLFWTVVAEMVDSGQLVGYPLFFNKYSTLKGKGLWLCDFYVKAEQRGLGVGRSLFKAMVKHAADTSCNTLEWNCLQWNHNSVNFYKKFGAKEKPESKEWLSFELNKQQIQSISNETDKSDH